MYLNLERIAKELRGAVPFKGDVSPVKGDKNSIEFFALSFDYPMNTTQLLDVTYAFKEGALVKTSKDPLKGEVLKTFDFMENVEKISFYYFNNAAEEEEQWQDEWTDGELPEGVKIELVYKDNRG